MTKTFYILMGMKQREGKKSIKQAEKGVCWPENISMKKKSRA